MQKSIQRVVGNASIKRRLALLSALTIQGAAALASALVAGCSGTEGLEATGEVHAELKVVPTGLQCVRFISSNGNLTRTAAVTAGSSSATLSLGLLNLGDTTITAAGFNVACASIGTNNPTWIGDPVRANVLASGTAPIRIVLVPATSTNVAVDFIQPVAAITVGSYFTLARGSSGDVRGWGQNTNGLVGDGTTTNRLSPVASTAVGNVAQVSAGGSHACAVTSAGALKCWGNNAYGQLGDGTTTNRTSPVTAIASGVAKVSAGGLHTCAVMTDGSLRCTGLNSIGQLGLGNQTNVSTFTQVGNAAIFANEKVIDVVAGLYHTCATTQSKWLFCWGSNGSGELGINAAGDFRTSPQYVDLPGVESFGLGAWGSCALTAGGEVWCWGLNASGQVGDGTTVQRNVPTKSVMYQEVTSLAVTERTRYAITRSGDVYVWGDGSRGPVGTGQTQVNPTWVPTLQDALSIAASNTHACAWQGNGDVSCWGDGQSGSLGNGGTDDEFVPTPVSL